MSYLKKIIIIFKQSTGAVSYLNWKQVQISNIHTFQIIVCFFRKMRFHLLHPQAHNEQTDKYAPEQGERKKKKIQLLFAFRRSSVNLPFQARKPSGN